MRNSYRVIRTRLIKKIKKLDELQKKRVKLMAQKRKVERKLAAQTRFFDSIG